MRLIDHHCHLDFPHFDADRADVVARARAAGVDVLISISTRIRELDRLLATIMPFDNVFCSVGTHPHYADSELDITAEEIARLAEHPRIVAIGEAGLDYFYQKSTREGQADGLKRHIRAARKSGLPLVIHSRDADADTARVLEEAAREEGPYPALLHCFTGGWELARRALALGASISFSGVVTFKGSHELRRIAAAVPLDRILVETDSPYLAPQPRRGARNEPAYVVHTAQAVAEARGMEVEELAAATTQNVLRLFAKLPRPSAEAVRAGEAAR